MEKSAKSATNNKSGQYPLIKIRSLIKNLDLELLKLYQQTASDDGKKYILPRKTGGENIAPPEMPTKGLCQSLSKTCSLGNIGTSNEDAKRSARQNRVVCSTASLKNSSSDKSAINNSQSRSNEGASQSNPSVNKSLSQNKNISPRPIDENPHISGSQIHSENPNLLPGRNQNLEREVVQIQSKAQILTRSSNKGSSQNQANDRSPIGKLNIAQYLESKQQRPFTDNLSVVSIPSQYRKPIISQTEAVVKVSPQILNESVKPVLPVVIKQKSNFTKSSGLGNISSTLKLGDPLRRSNIWSRVHLVKVKVSKQDVIKEGEGHVITTPNNMMSQVVDANSVQTKTLSSVYRARVIDAFRNRRIFTIFGNYGTIRRALLKRGWLEKLAPNRYPRLQMLTEDTLLMHAKRGNEYETVAISKIINHFPAFFIWQPKGHRDLYVDVRPYRNRIRRSHGMDFSTKVGLIGCSEQLQWHRQDGVSNMLYPRFFRLGGNHEEQAAFIEEFRMSQCRALLRFLCRNVDNEEIIDYENGTISPVIIPFAAERARRQLEEIENKVSLDVEPVCVPEYDWAEFLQSSGRLLNRRGKLKCTYRELNEYVKKIKPIITRLDEKRADYKFDGCRNMWILKPGYQCRGLNIVIRNNMDEILNWATNHMSRRYIVQKYIEQPLLIYRTKFDIRQYMLLYIRESTVQIWLYKDCYLRFSSQEYTIDDLREVIHLTNNSVQKKYKNKTTRDPRLPRSNMWSLEQFKAYIDQKSLPDDIWENQVYAGFKQNLIAVVLASLDETNLCENCFELYGCDFMLDEQYNPILIEINSTPDLSPSTEVTARICPMVMIDVIKVVIDLPRNSRASTGLFEKIYEINYKFRQDPNQREALDIKGKSMELCKRSPASMRQRFYRKNVKKFENNEIAKGKSQMRMKVHQKASPAFSPRSSSVRRGHGPKVLQAATREALAIRYTMPK
uniref:Tubulin glycylase 3B n=1 Tax=Glossina pallidipes TaxID=7398 RepID=A0A1A9ZFD8_GLOPL